MISQDMARSMRAHPKESHARNDTRAAKHRNAHALKQKTRTRATCVQNKLNAPSTTSAKQAFAIAAAALNSFVANAAFAANEAAAESSSGFELPKSPLEGPISVLPLAAFIAWYVYNDKSSRERRWAKSDAKKARESED
mmetsp:Transcript_12715/g.28857  ORF Transcript_12715/g.28857 Transcript_12715/m.28857 type:complete len:139 (+) Transcript_12715:57-473(+)